MSMAATIAEVEPLRHVLRSQQFSREVLESLFHETRLVRTQFQDRRQRSGLVWRLKGCSAVNLFYEPSTRTRLSFHAAQNYLGMHVLSTENAAEFSSSVKGESLEDTIRVISGYFPDVIVLRHFEDGAAERAAHYSSAPIINAGDGRGQHPTQSLMDLFTIHDELGTIDGLTVVIGGDLVNGRTAHSLAYLLSKFNCVHIIFVSPRSLRMKTDILEHLDQGEVKKRGVTYEERESLHDVLPRADVVYWTRIQKERMETEVYEQVKNQFIITSAQMAEMQKRSILMHPLPRVGEILPEVDDDPRAAYFRQASNALFVRMALLIHVVKCSA